MFKNIRADLETYRGDWAAQGFWVMVVYRFGRWRYSIHPGWLRKPFSLFYKISFKWVQIVTGIELPCETTIGQGFVIDHFGGIVVSGYARFGDRCRIRNGVVVGLLRTDEPCAPKIGNDVDIGSGAKLLGAITIGNNVAIGANAVVTCNVPDNCIAVGVPAVVKPRTVRAKGRSEAMNEVSSVIPDWSRENRRAGEWNPGKRLLASIRDYQKYRTGGVFLAALRKPWAVLRHRLWSVVTGADIPLNCQLGGGLLLPHPNGVVIHPGAVIGPNCLIFQQVTLGTRGTNGAPHVGGHVDIGAGAKLLGPITIGDNVAIGANAVVTCNVPDNCIAIGVPATVKPLRNLRKQL